MTTPVLILFGVFLATGGFSPAASARKTTSCTSADFQRCRSCASLAGAISKSKPDAGDYYRGARWNGLFAAYRLNCMEIAEVLLANGANPNSGGEGGSMPITVSRKWPHNREDLNQKWAELLLRHGASSGAVIPDSGKSSEAMIKAGDESVEYPKIWKLFTK